MNTADCPTEVTEVICVQRNGRDCELLVGFRPAYMVLPARLVIGGGWVVDPDTGRGEFAHWGSYAVRVSYEHGGGRMFILTRDPQQLLRLPFGGDRRPTYDVWVGPSSDRCDCRGWMYSREPCKHVLALRWAQDKGFFDTERTVPVEC